MKEQVSEQLQVARDRYENLSHQLFLYSVENSSSLDEEKEYLLRGKRADLMVVVRIGTTDFFKETILAAWELQREFLTEHERRIGEGKIELLWNLMKVEDQTEVIPPKEQIDAWAENMGLLSPMIHNLIIAAGYGSDQKRLISEQYYDDIQTYYKWIGREEQTFRRATLPETIRIHGFLLAHDFRQLASEILIRIRSIF